MAEQANQVPFWKKGLATLGQVGTAIIGVNFGLAAIGALATIVTGGVALPALFGAAITGGVSYSCYKGYQKCSNIKKDISSNKNQNTNQTQEKKVGAKKTKQSLIAKTAKLALGVVGVVAFSSAALISI